MVTNSLNQWTKANVVSIYKEANTKLDSLEAAHLGLTKILTALRKVRMDQVKVEQSKRREGDLARYRAISKMTKHPDFPKCLTSYIAASVTDWGEGAAGLQSNMSPTVQLTIPWAVDLGSSNPGIAGAEAFKDLDDMQHESFLINSVHQLKQQYEEAQRGDGDANAKPLIVTFGAMSGDSQKAYTLPAVIGGVEFPPPECTNSLGAPTVYVLPHLGSSLLDSSLFPFPGVARWILVKSGSVMVSMLSMSTVTQKGGSIVDTKAMLHTMGGSRVKCFLEKEAYADNCKELTYSFS